MVSGLYGLYDLAWTAQAWAYSGGTGEPNDPYQIADANDLIELGNDPCNYDKCFVLTADIDLSGYSFDRAVIAPDVNDTKDLYQGIRFSGRFDGQNHVIRHLLIQGRDYLGLFGSLDQGAVISNLRLKEVDIDGKSYLGGLVGYSSGVIIYCSTAGSIQGVNEVIGGLVGDNHSGYIVSSYSNVSVNGHWLGGADVVGGLVGGNSGLILSSYSVGWIRGDGECGGLVGVNNEGAIMLSYSLTEVEFGYGLVGLNYKGIVQSSFWNIETSGQPYSDGGTGLTTAQMQDPNTFLDAGWNFVGESVNGTHNVWQIQDGNYPTQALPVELNGAGTPNDPYLIMDANDLGAVWLHPKAHYRLAADIDLVGIHWNMAVIPWFGGVFDGNDHVIRNLHIDGNKNLGLFGELNSGAMVWHLGLETVDVNGAGDNIGSLAGYSDANGIIACYANGSWRWRRCWGIGGGEWV